MFLLAMQKSSRGPRSGNGALHLLVMKKKPGHNRM